MSDLQDRIDRIAALVLAKGSGLTHPSDTEVQIRRILEAWGPRTTYRYLRDHGLLESFVSGLPMPTYAANDPQTILETFQGSWDDFSADALAKLEAWQMESSAAALLPRLAAYAGQLFGSGHAVAARRVLRVAKTVADQSRLETQDVVVEDLKVGDLVRSVGSETIGFGPDHLAGRVRSVRIDRDVKTAATTVKVVVHVAQRDATHTFDAPAGTHVEAARLVRPDHAQSLRLAALDRLMRAEEALEGVPAAQSRVARLRHELSATITQDREVLAYPQKFRFRVYVGPIGGKEVADKISLLGYLTAHLVGTEHIYFDIEADSAEEAKGDLLSAIARAGYKNMIPDRHPYIEMIKSYDSDRLALTSEADLELSKAKVREIDAAHRCPDSPNGEHEPDPFSVAADQDAGRNRGTDWIVDVNCKYCFRGGSTQVNPKSIVFEDTCTDTSGKHVPDPASLVSAPDAGRNRGTDWIVDVSCKKCGSIGSTRFDSDAIDFD